ncbi:hypothetical protein NPIL_230801 [Nephila pilipes]|uniref:Uncharacterized protein n=1 Tax=Nephila pilipes TaxID=299642 RepID=A0A8X6PMU2_NEPPI|nr:hypothetical protein NPIL_230801 [Nephila pilipes]
MKDLIELARSAHSNTFNTKFSDQLLQLMPVKFRTHNQNLDFFKHERPLWCESGCDLLISGHSLELLQPWQILATPIDVLGSFRNLP